MKKNLPLYICIFCLILLNIMLISCNITDSKNQEKYLRLHVVANSNRIEDQIIKLNVANKITSYLNNLCKGYNFLSQKDDVKKLALMNTDNILEVAKNELKSQNATYNCHINIGKISYDKKESNEITMKKGVYDSIQIVLGDGNGENFWSLIFPNFQDDNISSKNEIHDIEIKSGFLELIKKVVKTF